MRSDTFVLLAYACRCHAPLYYPQSIAFAAWEDALEKLKALDYEASFCKPNNLQPFSRYD